MADESNLGPVTADPETVTDVKIPTAKKTEVATAPEGGR